MVEDANRHSAAGQRDLIVSAVLRRIVLLCTLTEITLSFYRNFRAFFLPVGFLKIIFRNFRYHTGSLTNIPTLHR